MQLRKRLHYLEKYKKTESRRNPRFPFLLFKETEKGEKRHIETYKYTYFHTSYGVSEHVRFL